ncbi:MAG: hypothetical protein PHE47_00240 [Oscillospiraceae bacterium]|nr:hypothetical protein [Oscillospiraceae bacterium]
MSDKKEPFLMYKGKPLVRSGNTLYYGDMNDPYVIMMQIASTHPGYDMDMAEKISIQLLATDTDLRPKERIIRKSEKVGLYNALDIGSIWLERALAGTM